MDPTSHDPPADGRADRFRRIFDGHHEQVLRYAQRRASSHEAAEDVAAETFVVVWRRLEDVPDDPLPWLYATARALVANERRGSRRREALMDRAHDEARIAAQEGTPADGPLLDALARLPEGDREALLLVAWEGLDRRRAARALGCSLPAFATRLHRARRRLAAELDRERSGGPARPHVAEEAR